jgi:hypothetical protein
MNCTDSIASRRPFVSLPPTIKDATCDYRFLNFELIFLIVGLRRGAPRRSVP